MLPDTAPARAGVKLSPGRKSPKRCQFKGRPILVNTARKCDHTYQFEKLEGMYKPYKDRGLVVLGFPSNDFRQELTSNKEVGDFCRMTYGVQFPMVEKTSVAGDAANPFLLTVEIDDFLIREPNGNAAAGVADRHRPA